MRRYQPLASADTYGGFRRTLPLRASANEHHDIRYRCDVA